MSTTKTVDTLRIDRTAESAPPPVWRELLVAAAIASAVAFAVVAILLRDLEAAAYVGAFGLGLVLLRVRKGLAGVIALGLLSLNVLGWMALGTASNLRQGQGFLAVAIPALLAVLALVAVIAAGAELARRSRPGGSRTAVRVIGGGALTVFVLLAAAGALTGTERPITAGGDLTVVSDNVLFRPTELQAAPGEVTLHMENRDLFWHTVTIDELEVDLAVAVGGRGSVTFNAPAGVYEYYCRIPGHETRMRGTLVVE